MKEKNFPDDNTAHENNHESIEELKKKVNILIEELEQEKDLKNSLEKYQKLINLNNTIEKGFQKLSKNISLNFKEKIEKIIKKKNAK